MMKYDVEKLKELMANNTKDSQYTKDYLYNEYDLLKGNINRICVTDDADELERMYKWALKRLNIIYKYNQDRLILDNFRKLTENKEENK